MEPIFPAEWLEPGMHVSSLKRLEHRCERGGRRRRDFHPYARRRFQDHTIRRGGPF